MESSDVSTGGATPRQAEDRLSGNLPQETKMPLSALLGCTEYCPLLFSVIPEAVVVADADTLAITDANEVALHLYGYSREEFLKMQATDLSAEPEVTAKAIQATASGAVLRVPLRYHKKNDGTVFPVEISRGIFTLNGRRMAIGVIRDISERVQAKQELEAAKNQLDHLVRERTAELEATIDKLEVEILRHDLVRKKRQESEEQLRLSREQLRALTNRRLSIQEEERTRIAREVHDELGQVLTALKFDLVWLKREFSGKPWSCQKADKIAAMIQQVDSAINTVRRITTELRPGVLDDLGLEAAMEWQVQEFQNRTGIVCELSAHLENQEPDRGLSTALFRVLQETLTNIARHAGATWVHVTLGQEEGNLFLEVRDNGRGITVEEVSHPHSLGITGMLERVLPWGGEVRIHGSPARGTVVTVRIPRTESAGSPEGNPP